MKAVLMLLGQSEGEATWDSAKKLMVNPKSFIQSLNGFQAETVPSKVIKSVGKFAKTEEFAATKAPKTAGILTQWVIAVLDARQ